MSLTSSDMSVADIAAVMGTRNNDGFGGFGGDGWWILLLFILLGNGAWGNGFGFGGNSYGRNMNSYRGNSYRGGYSRDGENEHMMNRMQQMMNDAQTEQERETIRRMMETM